MLKRMGEIRVTAPVPGACPVCATVHDKREPHDLNSLYYQNRFYKAHKRFPTWEDALSHCDAATKSRWAEILADAGVKVSFRGDA